MFDTPSVSLRFNPFKWIKSVVIELVFDFIAGITLGWVCNGLSKTHGIEDYCGYAIKQALAGIVTSGRYRVSKYFYKDPNCVPPHSYMCNSAPYAYYKYTMTKVYSWWEREDKKWMKKWREC